MRNGGAKVPRGACRRLCEPPQRRTGGTLHSPGVRYVGERLRGRWLVALIVSHQQQRRFAESGRQSWRLTRLPDGSQPSEASLICRDGQGRVLLSLTLTTDFPAPGVEIMVADDALFLPSEDWMRAPTGRRRLAARLQALAVALRRAMRGTPGADPAGTPAVR